MNFYASTKHKINIFDLLKLVMKVPNLRSRNQLKDCETNN